MSLALLIAISFSIGFFIESIIGFGAGLIAYSIIGFFSDLIDIKTMILAGLYIGTCASSYIFYTDHKSFDWKIFKATLLISLLGTVLGSFIFSKVSAPTMALCFAIILIILAIKNIFFDHYVFPKMFKRKLVFAGGLCHGMFGVGGPFWVNGLIKDFKNKSALRTTLAAMFVSFNLVRIIQLTLQGEVVLEFFYQIWWTIIPVFIMIYAGYHVHNRISEGFFKRLIAIITLLSGIKFLINFLTIS